MLHRSLTANSLSPKLINLALYARVMILRESAKGAFFKRILRRRGVLLLVLMVSFNYRQVFPLDSFKKAHQTYFCPLIIALSAAPTDSKICSTEN